jgi:1-deoxy-D-xylulose-5-phosphate synthase
VLEAANAAGLESRQLVRVGIPDRFIEHAERGERPAKLRLDVDGLCRTVLAAVSQAEVGRNRAADCR